MSRTPTDDPLHEAAYRGKHIGSSSKLNEDYTDEEREFLTAIQAYKTTHQRPNPTCCEILAVLISLGYRKV